MRVGEWSVYVSVCLCLSVSVSLFLSLSFCLCLSVRLSVCLSLSLRPSLPLSLSLSLFVSLPSHLFQFLHWLPVQQTIQYKINILCYKCITGTAPSYLRDSPQLYTLPYSPLCFSYSQPPDFTHQTRSPLLVPASFLFSVHQHGIYMTFPFLSDRNPLWTRSNATLKHLFSQNCRPAMFSVPCCCLHPSQVSVCCPF